jgi:hypothetical protein
MLTTGSRRHADHVTKAPQFTRATLIQTAKLKGVVCHVIPHPGCHVIPHPGRCVCPVWASLEGSLWIRLLADGRALMARRSIVMFDLIELFTHWHAGRSQVQLSESLGIDRKTIRKYLAPAIVAGIEPGGEPLSVEQWASPGGSRS